jgi:hypothetical protein
LNHRNILSLFIYTFYFLFFNFTGHAEINNYAVGNCKKIAVHHPA